MRGERRLDVDDLRVRTGQRAGRREVGKVDDRVRGIGNRGRGVVLIAQRRIVQLRDRIRRRRRAPCDVQKSGCRGAARRSRVVLVRVRLDAGGEFDDARGRPQLAVDVHVRRCAPAIAAGDAPRGRRDARSAARDGAKRRRGRSRRSIRSPPATSIPSTNCV